MKKAMTILALFVLLTSFVIADTQAVEVQQLQVKPILSGTDSPTHAVGCFSPDTGKYDPTMEITPTVINEMVPVGSTLQRTITVTNNGDAPLDWAATIENQTDLKSIMLENSYYGPAGPSEISDYDPGTPHTYYPTNEETWDILFNYDVTTATGSGGIAGAEFGNGVFLAAEWGYNNGQYRSVFKLDVEGNLIGSWTPTWGPDSTGLKDMAFDGEYFYAGTASSTTIYQFDEDGTLFGTISSPVNVRSIAYDSDNDAFWVNDWDEDMKLIDRSGNVLNTISSPPSLYGSAYDNISDGGPYLWLFTGTTAQMVCQVEQFSLTTMSLTGVSHSVSDDFGDGVAGGLFTSGDIVPGTLVLGGLRQGTPQTLFGYELCSYTIWIDPNFGNVDPNGGTQNVTVTFNAGSDSAGTIHTCDILFDSPQVANPVSVSVTMMVSTPEYGTLTGTVTSTNDGTPIEGALVTAGTYTEYTNSSGVYTFDEILIGTYTIECTVTGYNPLTAPNSITIEVGETTTLNFSMDSPIMTVGPSVISEQMSPGSSMQIGITIGNVEGSGELKWTANIINQSKKAVSTSKGSIGWVIEMVNNAACWFDTDAPSVLNDVFAPSFETNAGDFGPGNDTHMYFFDNDTRDIIYVDMATGSTTIIGNTGLPENEVIDDMAFDRTTNNTMYCVYNNSLYTIDLSTGTLTLIGPIGNTDGFMAAIAVDGSGNIWGHDIYLGEIWAIDKTTGAGTSIGSTGFNANYYGSMAWDQKSDIVYLAAFNSSNWYYELRTVDLSTGETQLLGGVLYKLIAVLAFPGTPWITIEPEVDSVAAGQSGTLTVLLNTADYAIGDILTCNIVIDSDPDVGTVTIPVTVQVQDVSTQDDPVAKETKLLGNFPNPMLHSTSFQFSLKERSHVKLSIYNLKGQLVGTVVDTEFDPAPVHAVVWNGAANGKTIANGIYFYKLETDNKTFLKKMILMK